MTANGPNMVEETTALKLNRPKNANWVQAELRKAWFGIDEKNINNVAGGTIQTQHINATANSGVTVD